MWQEKDWNRGLHTRGRWEWVGPLPPPLPKATEEINHIPDDQKMHLGVLSGHGEGERGSQQQGGDTGLKGT